MSRSPDNFVKLNSETLSLREYKSGGNQGFWLYDKTRGMNLSMKGKSEIDAFVQALHYYQKRLKEVEQKYAVLAAKVEVFIDQFAERDD